MAAIAAGTTVGQYEILAKLKSGGMATLYLARRVSAAGFKRHVAIKVVHEHLADDRAFVRMFVDEALLQARIHHPNVVHVEELGDENGQHFLVMEYVHGCSLAALMAALARKDRRLVPEVAAQIAVQVASGLHAAHELRDEHGQSLGVVHRDVSPQNVLLAYDGHVKLIDFGVAKAKNRESTIGGSLKGKLRYMAPEQALSRRTVDRRVDVYALGIVLWEMLTHRRCFTADDDIQLLDMIRDPQIAPPSTIAPQVSPALDAVVMKALAKQPEERYQSAHELRRALAGAIPEAMLVDATQIADLLGAAMAGDIERDKTLLPDSVSGVIANEQRRQAMAPRGDEALRTMTLSGAGLSYLLDASGAHPPSGSGVRSQESRPVPPAPTPPPPAAPSLGAPSLGAPSLGAPSLGAPSLGAPSLAAPPLAAPPMLAAPVVGAEGRSGNRAVIAVAVAAVIVAGIAAIGLALALGSGSGDDMVATPLAPPAGGAAGPTGPAPQAQRPPEPTPAVTRTDPAAEPAVAEPPAVAGPPAVAEPPAVAGPAVEPPVEPGPAVQPAVAERETVAADRATSGAAVPIREPTTSGSAGTAPRGTAQSAPRGGRASGSTDRASSRTRSRGAARADGPPMADEF